MQSFIEFIRRMIAAFQHVKTGGKSTKTRARRIASRPPRKCHACGQTVQHNTDPGEYQAAAACGHEDVPPNRY